MLMILVSQKRQSVGKRRQEPAGTGRGVGHPWALVLQACGLLSGSSSWDLVQEALVEILHFPTVFLSILESLSLDRYWHRHVLHEGPGELAIGKHLLVWPHP